MPDDLSRFKDQLNRQLDFIDRSCMAYDDGHTDEAVRIATTIRVLMHDTRSSTSLLTHLGAKQVEVLTTAKADGVGPATTYFEGLLGFSMKGLKPKLGNAWPGILVSASDWWAQVVLVEKGKHYLRKDIVLAAANKDGGAHVDEHLTDEYQSMLQGLWMQVVPGESDGPEPAKEHQFMMIRQMGYELLSSKPLREFAQ